MGVLSTEDFVHWVFCPQGILSIRVLSMGVLSTMGLCGGIISTRDNVRWGMSVAVLSAGVFVH